MEVVAIVLPIALLMGCLAVWMFIRCVRCGQFDDLDTPPLRMLTDDAPISSQFPGRKPAASARGRETRLCGSDRK
ncbi:MAG TPA: cbb3-type cytochrome oxidase assembly protein CcoS [Phycisphaerales bacterium]|nr:cbb3-type cytochrome oxidase assembly protein CcoS [Phycisphaerales bacterium]